ncbi:MAG: hypothetical protein IRZ10_11040 [Thermoflavifilum sp.]|nr:hypothetical protein [Thermoflavifilum sp.]MCL6514941.1 DUF5716 family protein [Alicyclobacillus sp.]
MQDLFDVVPENLFSPLASPNRRLYFRALMVLRECYRHALRLRRQDVVNALIHDLEQDLWAWTPEDEADESVAEPSFVLGRGDADAGEGAESTGGFSTLSGKAHALLRKLVSTGWAESIPDETGMDETLVIPRGPLALLEAFHSIIHPQEQRYQALVYTIYSTLRTADEERDEFMAQALHGAHERTQVLVQSLQALLHSIHLFYQNLYQRREIQDLLREHFDEFQQKVAIPTYHPLKTVDSVYRFKPRILTILRRWLADGEVIRQLARLEGGSADEEHGWEARSGVVEEIQFIIDTFESMDDLLREIDRRNTHYSRASAERLQYLLNTDRDLKGKLIEVLKALPPLTARGGRSKLLERMRTDLAWTVVRWRGEESLYTPQRRRERGVPQPLRVSRSVPEEAFEREVRELAERMASYYSMAEISRFLRERMGGDGRLRLADLHIRDMDDFIRAIVALAKADEPDFPFDVVWDDALKSVEVDGWRLPAVTFVMREGQADAVGSGV